MNAANLLECAAVDGVLLDLVEGGGLHYSGDPAAVNEWLPILRENKAAILAELNREARRQKVIAMLGDDRKFAVLVENPDTDPVICTVAIRGLASFEMAIPRKYYDGMALLELVEKHSAAEFSTTKGQKNEAHR